MVKTRRRAKATTVQTFTKKKVQKTYKESDSDDRSDSSSSMEDSEDEFRPPEAKVKTRKRKVPGSRPAGPAPTNPETNQPSTSDDYPPPSQEYVNFDKWYLYNRKDNQQEGKGPQEEPEHQEPVKPKRIRRDKERIAENKNEYEKYEKEEHPTVEGPKQMSLKEQIQLKQNIIKLQMRRKRKAYQKQLDNGRDPEDSDMAETNEEYERYQKDRKAKMAEHKKEERREYQKEAKQQWIVTRNERRKQFEEYRRAEGDMENIPEELKQAKKAWDWFEANRQCQITVESFEDHRELEEPEKEPEEEPEAPEKVAPIRTEKKRRQNKEERNEYTKLRYWERVARRKAYQEHLDKGGDPEDEEMAENKEEYERHEKFKERRRNRQREAKEAELPEEVQTGNHNGYRRQREVTKMNGRNRIEEYRRAGGDMDNIPEELKQAKKAWDWFEAQKGTREEERESQRTEEERRLVQSFQRRFRYVPHSHQQDNQPGRPSESALRNSSTDGSVERDDTAAHSLPSSSNFHWSASRRVTIKQEPLDNHEPHETEELIDDPGRLLHDFYHQGYPVNERNLAALAERTKLNVETCRSFMRTRKALDFFLKRFDYQTELFLEKWFWDKKSISNDVKITPLDLVNFRGRIRNSLGEVNEWFRKRMIDDVLFPIKNYEDPEDYIIRTVNRKVGLVEDDLKAKFYAKGKTTMSTHQLQEINKRFNLTPEEANRWLQNNKYFDDLDEYVAQKFDASIVELSKTSMIYQMLDHNETRCFELKCKYPDKISDAEFHKKFPPNHPFYTKIRRMIRQEIEKREQSQLDYLPVKMEATNLSTARCIFESILENGKTQKFEIQDEFVKATMGLPISGFVLNEFFKQQCEAANIS